MRADGVCYGLGFALWVIGLVTGFVLARGPREWREAWRYWRRIQDIRRRMREQP